MKVVVLLSRARNNADSVLRLPRGLHRFRGPVLWFARDMRDTWAEAGTGQKAIGYGGNGLGRLEAPVSGGFGVDSDVSQLGRHGALAEVEHGCKRHTCSVSAGSGSKPHAGVEAVEGVVEDW